MTDTTDKDNTSINVNSILEHEAEEAQASRRAKRIAQHQHWMRVMMEGQATPDLTYQKPKS